MTNPTTITSNLRALAAPILAGRAGTAATKLILSIGLGVMLGALYVGAGVSPTLAQEPPPLACDDTQCLNLCAGSTCWEYCTSWSEWDCAGGDGWCLSVQCPLLP